jgi:phenylpropionate dioxygenase-like ring-hydroxylating dioxygenase large terminal subunit
MPVPMNSSREAVARASFTRLSNGESLESMTRPQEGLISRRIFADPEIFEMEEERIFGRAWFCLGHESEIPNRGDLVTRPCGIDSAIVLRDENGIVRAFLNSCRHAGMKLCRTDREENVRFLRCPYHGWSYRTNGALAATVNERHYGAGELEKHELGLIPVAQLGVYQGLIFATWSEKAPSLEEWLGDMRWYIDIIFGRTGGIEIVGVPQTWDVDCSWKFPAANFPDNQHVFSTHQSLVQLGMLPNDPDFASHGHIVTLENGHLLHFVQGPPGIEEFMGLGLPKELWPRFNDNLTPAQAQIFVGHSVSVGTLWPNFHWLQLATAGDVESKPTGFLNLRLETPLTPTRTRMYSWFAIDRAASEDYRDASYKTYMRTFGPGGVFDQDDMETLEDCTAAATGPAAKRHSLHQKMGLNCKPDPRWPGPGVAFANSYGEEMQRAWYREWLRAMSQPFSMK